MSKPKLTYFDMPISRGEECRLALHLAGVDFEDHRIVREAWNALKPGSPYGSMPILEMPGHAPLAQSNAILVLIGHLHDLHPQDLFEAARHEGMMSHVEDLRNLITPTMRIKDEAEKKAAREALCSDALPAWAGFAEKNIQGPFFGGTKISVVDLKIYMAMKWILGGGLDNIPATVFASFTKLNGVFTAVRDHAEIISWYAKQP
jgi:prostaglandin-H2 D-isomerase / glutathione transferase